MNLMGLDFTSVISFDSYPLNFDVRNILKPYLLKILSSVSSLESEKLSFWIHNIIAASWTDVIPTPYSLDGKWVSFLRFSLVFFKLSFVESKDDVWLADINVSKSIKFFSQVMCVTLQKTWELVQWVEILNITLGYTEQPAPGYTSEFNNFSKLLSNRSIKILRINKENLNMRFSAMQSNTMLVNSNQFNSLVITYLYSTVPCCHHIPKCSKWDERVNELNL